MTGYAFADTARHRALPLNAEIVATATALPEKVVSNDEIIHRLGQRMSGTAIEKLVGVRTRRVAPDESADTDLLVVAAKRCLERARMRPDDLSKIIVTRFLGDHVLPMTAACLQQKLGCDTAIQAFDIDGGVHGFFSALHTAACAVDSGDDPVLIVSGGIVNRLVSARDPMRAFRFGDGAGAVLVRASDIPKVRSVYAFSNHRFLDDAVAFRVRDFTGQALYTSEHRHRWFSLYEETDWRRSVDFVRDAMAMTVRTLLDDAALTMTDVDLFLMTENHHRLRVAMLERLEIPDDRTISLLPSLGNTMSAMLPILLDHAIDTGRAGPGSRVMLLSVGEGIQGGGMLMTL